MEVVRSMGGYLNPGSDLFEMALRSQIFVDKSGLIEKSVCANITEIYLREQTKKIRKIYGC